MHIKHLVLKIGKCMASVFVLAGLMAAVGGSALVSEAQARDLTGDASMTVVRHADSVDAGNLREERANWRLEHALTQLQLALQMQEDRLLMADETIVFLQQLSVDLEADGKDTAELEAAIDDFATSVETANVLWNEAHQALDAAAGFDIEGKVVDPDQARDTIETARDAMADCRRILKDGTTDLRRALREYRQALGDEAPSGLQQGA